jgi:hypothetical protein
MRLRLGLIQAVLNPGLDWTLNGLNPKGTQPRRDSTQMDSTVNRLDPEGTQPRMDSTPNELNSEWTELRMGLKIEKSQHRKGLSPNGRNSEWDSTQNELNLEWDSTSNRLNTKRDSTSNSSQPQIDQFQLQCTVKNNFYSLFCIQLIQHGAELMGWGPDNHLWLKYTIVFSF